MSANVQPHPRTAKGEREDKCQPATSHFGRASAGIPIGKHKDNEVLASPSFARIFVTHHESQPPGACPEKRLRLFGRHHHATISHHLIPTGTMPTISDRYPEYQATARLDELRATEYSYLDSQGHVYLDYTGSGLAASAQIRHHNERLSQNLYGNPHSSNPTSAAATEAMDRTRARILAHLNASPDEYTVIFTVDDHGGPLRLGKVVDERIVAMESAAARISLRTGCFCNPGAGEAAFELDFKGVRKLSITRKLSRSRQASGGLDQFIDALGMPYLGAIRVSFGLASNVADVDKFFGFAEKTYKDRVITELGLPPRIQC
ncbi:hypothetical protein CHGG_10775 [Chaetomium globosum CBS 148.51]|uniref:Aminotransferase class V domain-containing protein n=1 Tax=Chaetomium globosum (strain ATCC 6205 / CBS 148.51 / DSM 1962 / NBRC 6347 / NRRL 1970) TaxID=306901 RepID=Q2GMM9_CHAGB|nr:uncharacterized protein CHGG_10775 [Chaetomium globosum CBS 148.51]EAQ82957.1 hypothetical protein CHGG_10775 [Chaetomium globosum CBS 148.51]